MQNWTVTLDLFEGPLDLLLHLVRKQELDIHDIPVALITSQYLDHIERMQELNLAVASDFFLMAATLLQIKARALLPRPPDPEQAIEEEDPREALVARLLEFERFRVLAEQLAVLRDSRSHLCRGPCRMPPAPEVGAGEAELYDLMIALSRVLTEEEVEPHEVQPEEGSIEEMARVLVEMLGREPGGVALEDVFSCLQGRSRMVALFVALLELVRSGACQVLQRRPFTRVWIRQAPQGQTEGLTA